MPFDRLSRAFTIVELLVVIAIIGILAGMSLGAGTLNRDRGSMLVEQAAKGVERKLLEARRLALASRKPHCVVFHIENKGSGAVTRNWADDDPSTFPGRHWCAVIGPAPHSDLVPRMPQFQEQQLEEYGSAQRLERTVEKSQIGERFYLPKGTRFLALGDAEDNLNDPALSPIPYDKTYYPIVDWNQSTKVRTGVSTLSDTYPRPWFGFLTGSGTAWTLNAFAGYDPGIYGSGLDYECTFRQTSANANYGATGMRVYPIKDTQVPIHVTNSTNTQACQCYYCPTESGQTPARNTNLEKMQPCCADADIGSPRPVVNGYWMDYAIIFLPDGQARALTFYNRQALFSMSTWLDPTGINFPVTPRTIGGVVTEVAASRFATPPTDWTYFGRDDAIIHILGDAIGGPSITIAKDAPGDSQTFISQQDALNSITPLRRVVVSEPIGAVRMIKPFASIQNWLDDIESTTPVANRIWKNGWVYCAYNDASPNKIRVTGALEPSMLSLHDPYPWIKPKP